MKRDNGTDECELSTPLQDKAAIRGIMALTADELALLPTEMEMTRRAGQLPRFRPAGVTLWPE